MTVALATEGTATPCLASDKLISLSRSLHDEFPQTVGARGGSDIAYLSAAARILPAVRWGGIMIDGATGCRSGTAVLPRDMLLPASRPPEILHSVGICR